MACIERFENYNLNFIWQLDTKSETNEQRMLLERAGEPEKIILVKLKV